MSKKLLYALIVIGLSVVVLIFNKGDVDINLVFWKISALKSLGFLGFISVGVLIGVLLK